MICALSDSDYINLDATSHSSNSGPNACFMMDMILTDVNVMLFTILIKMGLIVRRQSSQHDVLKWT
jgi:hypothetical protein